MLPAVWRFGVADFPHSTDAGAGITELPPTPGDGARQSQAMTPNFPTFQIVGQSFYVDWNVLQSIDTAGSPPLKLQEDIAVLRYLWECYRVGKIRLVTCKSDTRMEIVLWLRSLGCHVRNTLRIKEELQQFQHWKKVDTGRLQKLKASLDFLESIGDLPLLIHPYAGDYGAGEGPMGVSDDEHGTLAQILSRLLNKRNMANGSYGVRKQLPYERDILLECVTGLEKTYNQTEWNRRMQFKYDVHWDRLERAMVDRGLSPDPKDRTVKGTFMTLNRLVAFLSGGYPSMPSDRSVLVNEVEKAMSNRFWNYSQKERDARHIFHCIKYNVGNFLTMDSKLITNFDSRGHLIQTSLNRIGAQLNIVRPSRLLVRSR